MSCFGLWTRSTCAERWWAGGLVAALLSACSSVRPARTEDVARTMVPVPICLVRLARAAEPSARIALSEVEYWSLLLPGFDSERLSLDEAAPDCSGRTLLSDRGQGQRLHHPLGRAVVSPGPDAMKVVWLPSHESEGRSLGLLALVRRVEGYFEVYAVGVHGGAPGQTRFSVERMGRRIVVAATEERCEGEGGRCQSAQTVYGLWTGTLVEMGSFPLARYGRGAPSSGDAGLELRFSATAEFVDGAVELSEHLSVIDPAHGEVRASDLKRQLSLQGSKLVASADSLWSSATPSEPAGP